jgi:hypothetical protein
MKQILKRLADPFVRNDKTWHLLDRTLVRAAKYAERRRARDVVIRANNEFAAQELPEIFAEGTVRNGPFKGMRYPEFASIGSELLPKLLGSYERELHPLMERICTAGYTEVVDIGCAEGYYAVGFAIRMPQAIVYAFDYDPRAIYLCKRMASRNGALDRVRLSSFCKEDDLLEIQIRKKGLIMSDCEGFEKTLFTRDLVSRLKDWDFLIEVHDFIDIDISGHLQSAFEQTHSIEIVKSIDDIEKAKTYAYKELAGFDLKRKFKLLAEGRPAQMEWFFMQPKTVKGSARA